jgi:serine/threonine-protein kinase
MSQSGSEAYLILDYVEGPSLAEYLDATSRQGKIPSSDEIVRLLTPIAIALDYAHQRKVIHGALRPAAILLDRQIQPLLQLENQNWSILAQIKL